MRFSPSREQLDFATSLRELLAEADVPTVVRAWAGGDAAPGRKLWTRLADQGVLALGLPEEHGGFGATPVDLVLAFEQLGRAGVPGPYVESVAVLPALLVGTCEAGRLAELATGESMATLALPPLVPLALDAEVCDVVYLTSGSKLSTGRVTGGVQSVDKSRLLAEVTAADPCGDIDPGVGFDRGALATAAQILGAGEALLERSVEHAKQRRQFGAPIGSFQAVKHQLADAAVGLDVARSLLLGAAIALDTSTVARDVSAAKVACSDAAYRASRTALQVHGAIGYTAEYDLALWLTKVRALFSAWGTQRMHRGRVLAAIRE